LIYFVRKRRDLEFNWMFICFAIFIIACGTTHLMEILVVWHPVYWLSGSVKAITALASVPTAILLVKLIPEAAQIPSPSELRKANQELQWEIAERKRADVKLARSNEQLDLRVTERTRALETANQQLITEIQQRERIEKELRESRELLQAIVENSTAVIYVKDLEGRYLMVNRRFCELFHVSREQVIGKAGEKLHTKEQAGSFGAMDQEIVAAGCAMTAEETVRQDDGPHTYVSVKAPLRDGAGNIYAIFGISTDITDRKRTEKALEESQALYHSLVEQMPAGVFRKDAQGRYVFVNSWFCRLSSAKPEQFLGKTSKECAAVLIQEGTSLQTNNLTDLAERGAEDHERIMKTGERIELDEERVLLNDTKQFLHVVKAPVFGPDAKIAGSQGFLIDITERRLTEDRLKSSLQEVNDLKAALDEHSIVAITDPKGRISYVNDKFCAISKYSREELLGQDHRLINSRFHAKEFIRNLWETISHGDVWKGEICNQAKDGSFYWVDTTIVPFLDATGTPYQYVAIRTDITERKIAEEEVRKLNQELTRRVEERTVELQNANQELEAFCYSVSHDLRAPVRHIDGFVALLQKETKGMLSERSLHFLSQVSDSAKHMGKLIDDLLVFSRMSRSGINRTLIQLDSLFTEAIRKLAPDTQGRNIVWKKDHLPVINADEAMLRQVALNLLSNAIKYTRPRDPATIEIGSTTNDGETIVFVRDNGVGFDMAYAEKLFGVFQRLHSTEDFEGTGIGLANVRRIIARHGGRTWAEGKPDEGAIFYFSLPDRNSINDTTQTHFAG
jgi:PAS domain S-box-containing protein